MKKWFTAVLLAAPLTFSAPRALSAQVVDQSNYAGVDFFANLTYWSAQTFRTGATTTSLVGGGFGLFNTLYSTNTGTLEIKLYSNSAAACGVQLASSTVNYSVEARSYALVDAFWSPVGVNSNATYWLYIKGTSGSLTNLFTTFQSNNPYSTGDAVFVNSTSNIAAPASIYTNIYDLRFRTWTTTTVPEPSSFALLAVGGAVMLLVARRKRRA